MNRPTVYAKGALSDGWCSPKEVSRYADAMEAELARLTEERDAVCVWRKIDVYGGVYKTVCDGRPHLPPQGGYCPYCGKRVQIAGEEPR